MMDAVCARVQVHYMGRDVYASDWLKAAAVLGTIALHEPLEAKNEFFAWLVAETFSGEEAYRVVSACPR
ncbi:hypothetical protein ACFVY1_38970 [Streptomyces sp. NPDC058293]|uniref:hypothetical protein n=1 Tax=Streptomyces sp. NPDC058293 TaxID=3346429 RepID=UPI0036EA3F1D